MKTLRFDSVGGASGDMILAVLVGLGVDIRTLTRQLQSLKIGRFRISKKRVSDHGLTGARINVDTPASRAQPARGLRDIRKLIGKSRLSPRVKALSLRVFERLARAEAKVHGTTPDKVHFHEVGAMDSIIDIVGACAGLEMLGIDRVVVGPLPCGRGTIHVQHGVLPNPAPATVEQLKGHPVVQTEEPFELVTPTGAALLMEWKGEEVRGQRSEVRERKEIIVASANGFGHRKLAGRPNLLRATILEDLASPAPITNNQEPITDNCLVLETNIDDCSPEVVGYLSQRLMELGALDVFTTPVQMKKQRPGILLTVLCKPALRDLMIETIFRESTTFGIREHMTRRMVLQRRHVAVRTSYGKVRVKIGTWKGKDITRSPEYDDCVRCASTRNVAVRTVYESALRLAK